MIVIAKENPDTNLFVLITPCILGHCSEENSLTINTYQRHVWCLYTHAWGFSMYFLTCSCVCVCGFSMGICFVVCIFEVCVCVPACSWPELHLKVSYMNFAALTSLVCEAAAMYMTCAVVFSQIFRAQALWKSIGSLALFACCSCLCSFASNFNNLCSETQANMQTKSKPTSTCMLHADLAQHSAPWLFR